MEARCGKSVTGPMLKEKRKVYEELLQVSENEQLTGEGHGESGLVDKGDVQKDCDRIAQILSTYAPKDQWNFDETGLFGHAPPDQGLCTTQLSGKKRDKF
ncbi:hypothetical protein AX14_005892 [Amanita brunnescens Koide BX004]|nr:hypothetical protein AX14_005892 [Amanita brunnescens Koide BX004]